MPFIQPEKCTRCQKCAKDCPSKAIDLTDYSIDSTCIHCGHCVAICPEMAVMPDQGEIIPLGKVSVSGDDFRKLTASIRTCRSYSKKEVSEEVLMELVENMKHYPSASNKRELQITVIRIPEMIRQLNDATEQTLLKTIGLLSILPIRLIASFFIPSKEISYLLKYRIKFAEQKKVNTSIVCHHAPAVMLFHAPKTPFSMSGEDAYIWATYTSIYANTLGLGTCFNGFIAQAMKRSKKMRKQFGLPEEHQVHAALLVGYPKVNYRNETSRKSPVVSFV
jgi:nitroreductase/NAD-dependent dihydropyrimidine dehydrogenase PreA subunit